MDTTNTEALPDIERSDARSVTFSEWTLPTFERRDAALDASITAWDLVPWPEGLLAHTALAADDAPTIRHHSQWTSAAAFERFGRSEAPRRFAAIEADVGDIDRQDLALYEHHRSHHAARDAVGPVGCIVIVDVPLVEPDPGSQRDWIDTVMEALRVESPDGLVAAHFHVSTDGARVVNYAEWTSARAHRDSLDRGTAGSIDQSGSDEWRRVRDHPALAGGGRVTRYSRHRARAS